MSLDQLYKELKHKVIMMIATAVIQGIKDDEDIQKNQVSILLNDTHGGYDRYQEYGFSSVPLVGCQAVVACVGGARNHGLIIACDDPRYRPKDLEPGEVIVYNDKGDYVKFKTDRTIEVKCGTEVKVDCPTTRLTGNLIVEGNITAEGDIKDKSETNSYNMRTMRTAFNTHTHSETGSVTDVPTELME